jgi:hypothetical protein
MQTTEAIRFAGDVSIKKIEVVTTQGIYQDITGQVLNIQIFEDLFSPFITGSLILREALDLANLFPFIGEEFLNIEITTPTLPTKLVGKFYIYKMSDRQFLGDKLVVYQLHFISQEAVVDLNKRLSKSFSGKISDIANKFLTDKNVGIETNKAFKVESTPNSSKYISNYWTPVKNLNYIATQAVNQNKSPSYLFFENREGFNFVSLESLYKAPSLIEFVKDRYTRDKNTGAGSIKNINEDYKRISDITIPTAYNYLDRIRSGAFGSKLFVHDLVTKKYSMKRYDALEKYQSQSHLNKHSVISSKAIKRTDALIMSEFRDYASFNGFTDVTNTKIAQERMSLMKLAEANKIEITVPGRVDYTVGKKVSVLLYKAEPTSANDTDLTDKIFSGDYIISALNHYIDKEKHECVMELIKDSMIRDLDSGKQ